MTRKKTLRERAKEHVDFVGLFESTLTRLKLYNAWLAGYRAAVRDARVRKRKGRKK